MANTRYTWQFQTCQVSMLRMSEKFVDPSKHFPSVVRKILFLAFKGVWGMLPQKILKIMHPRLAKIDFMAFKMRENFPKIADCTN